ncbi:MAG: hypothetical protein AAF411_05480 [Myxococcota bacterium]
MIRRALPLTLFLALASTFTSNASANFGGGSLEDGAAQATSGRAIQLRPAFRYSLSSADDAREHGFGLDLQLRVFTGASAFHVGAFIAGDLMLDGSERFAGGFAGGYGPFGIQLGIAQRTAADGFAASTGVHLAKTLTFGPVGVIFRVTIPVASQGEQGLRERSFERAFTLSLGWNFGVSGQRPSHSCGGHGGGHGHGGSL